MSDFITPVLHGAGQAPSHMPIWTVVVLSLLTVLAIADAVRVELLESITKRPEPSVQLR